MINKLKILVQYLLYCEEDETINNSTPSEFNLEEGHPWSRLNDQVGLGIILNVLKIRGEIVDFCYLIIKKYLFK